MLTVGAPSRPPQRPSTLPAGPNDPRRPARGSATVVTKPGSAGNRRSPAVGGKRRHCRDAGGQRPRTPAQDRRRGRRLRLLGRRPALGGAGVPLPRGCPARRTGLALPVHGRPGRDAAGAAVRGDRVGDRGRSAQVPSGRARSGAGPVSYTHLTLPTKRIV